MMQKVFLKRLNVIFISFMKMTNYSLFNLYNAEKYFIGVIDKNLENTGNSYYYIIADTIKQIREINGLMAHEYLRNILVNYKRRRNLINILTKL
jgi:hypothetical protein